MKKKKKRTRRREEFSEGNFKICSKNFRQQYGKLNIIE